MKGSGYMNETLKDGTIDLLLDGVKKKIDSVKENFKWKRLFVDTGDFFINNPDMLREFENDLYSVFSEDNLYRLAQKLKNKRGYEFPQLLYKELHDLMICNEIPEREAETYSYHFVQVIINYLEDNDQEKTMEIFLGEMRRENEGNFTELKSTLEAVVEKINALGNEEVKVYSIADIDVEIKKKSKYKRMGLDFFELDDEQFESKFQNVIENDLIYVVGKSREETTFRILNELRSKKLESKTLIIKSEEEWDKLQKTSITGNILIPFFYTDQIAAITNNTNIFVYGEDEPCYTRDKLVLRKRTKRNIINSLENIGIDTQEAYNVVDNTHGLYVPLKKKIFNEANHVNPAWVKSHSSVIMAALLCGKWTDSEGDKLIFEELAGKTYSECKSELENYLHIENPYVVINSSYTRTENMQLASVEDAWEELDIYITKDLWDKFVELFFEVLIVSEPIFKYPFEKHFEASVCVEKPDWSPILKKGMIRTLIMRAYYRNHEENQKQIDDVVQKVLDKITSKEGWGYISQYLTDLCEASPKSVLKRLEDELQNPQGMLEMFAATDGDIVTGRHYYANVLWTVEQLIRQKKYVVRAVEWLWKVDSYNIKYSIGNSPKQALDVVFCAWINESALSADKKIELARKAMDAYPNAWDIICKKLPNGTHNSICSTLSMPKYRKVDDPETLYMEEVNRTYVEYLKMCVDYAGTNVERWIKLIEYIGVYDQTTQREAFEKMVSNCNEMPDEDKIKVKDAIKYEIYRNRYFQNSDWSILEERLNLYENSMNGIIVSNKIYEYIYIFSSKREFSLLRPKPYERNGSEDYYKINQTLREKEIETKIKEFKEQNYALEDLIRIAVKQKKDMVGEVLARFYCEGVYDSKTFNLLLRLDEEGKYVYDYVACLYRQGSINLSEIVELVKKSCDNKNLLINLISLETIEDERKALISKESEEIKRDYWNKILRVGISNKAEHRVYIWALEECKKYGSLNTYLELLYDVRNKILMQELFDNIFAIEELKNNNSCGMETYYLREILKDLQSVFIMDDEKCVRLANLEWLCRNVLEWDEMKCLQRVMKTDSAFYAELVKILFKGEENEPDDEEKRNLASKVYDGFYKAKFCPTEQDGKVVYEDIRKWIDDFKERLIEQKQERLFGNLIGHLLAYAPIGEDGYSPCEAVRKIIEENPLDTLKNAYVIEEENKRGVHTADAGKSELILSDRYKKNAEGLQEHYPQTAEIYFTLSDSYKREAAYERKRAEDEW